MLGELNDDTLTAVLKQLGAWDRRRIAITCRRWARILRGLHTALVLDRPAAQEGASRAALVAALLREGSRIDSLRCYSGQAADLEWQTFCCGLLAPRLRRLLLQCTAALPAQSLQWLAGTAQLQDLVLQRSVATLPLALASLRSLTRLAVVCKELDVDTPIHLPPSFSQLGTLCTLWLEDGMMALPGSTAGLGVLGALRDLTLRSCMLPPDLPDMLGSGLTALNFSMFWENEWDNLPLASLTALHTLGLSNCGLREVPTQVAQLGTLCILGVAGNGLEDLPLGPYLSSLQGIDIADNLIDMEWCSYLLDRRAPALRAVIHSISGEISVYARRHAGRDRLGFVAALPAAPSGLEEQWEDAAGQEVWRSLCMLRLPFADLPADARHGGSH